MGAIPNKIKDQMIGPFQNEDIFVVGEAFSDQQGWVEGALCMTEQLLEKYFHFKHPAWLDKEYYIG